MPEPKASATNAMSDAGDDPQHQPPSGPGVAVELSDKRRQLQELPEQSVTVKRNSHNQSRRHQFRS